MNAKRKPRKDEIEEEKVDGDEVVNEAADDAPQQPAEPPEPDDVTSVAALRLLQSRLDEDEFGSVWRVFFYASHTDAAMNHLHGLPNLRELWLIGSQVSKAAAEEFKAEKPNVTVYH